MSYIIIDAIFIIMHLIVINNFNKMILRHVLYNLWTVAGWDSYLFAIFLLVGKCVTDVQTDFCNINNSNSILYRERHWAQTTREILTVHYFIVVSGTLFGRLTRTFLMWWSQKMAHFCENKILKCPFPSSRLHHWTDYQ